LSNPLALLPIALAARGGRIDGLPAAGAVAAGFTLLQRSAPLVRAMAGRRSALLLPPSSAVLTALAASDGRGTVLLPAADPDALAAMLDDANVGAVFTISAFASLLPLRDHAVVLLDGTPRSAVVHAGGAESTVDLGSHFGLELAGEEDDGSDEECVVCYASSRERSRFTHRDLFTLARFAIEATSLSSGDHALALMPPASGEALTLAFAAPLLVGGRVSTMASFDADSAVRRLTEDGITHVVADATQFAALADALERLGPAVSPRALHVCLCLGAAPSAALRDRWQVLTGAALRVSEGIRRPLND